MQATLAFISPAAGASIKHALISLLSFDSQSYPARQSFLLFTRIKQISLLNYLCIICRLELLNDEAQDIEFIFIEPAVQFDLELRIYLDHVI